MELGFISATLKLSIPEILEWSAAQGFTCMEICTGPGEDDSDPSWKGHVNMRQVRAHGPDAIGKIFSASDLRIACLTSCWNFLDPDHAKREAMRCDLLDTVDLAADLAIPVVTCFTGRDPSIDYDANLAAVVELFKHVCEKAEKRDVKIAIENCPMPLRGFFGTPMNLAFNPPIWDAIFDGVGSARLGLTFDPAHLVFMQIDYVAALKEFGERVFHFHAKDAELLPDVMKRTGTLVGRDYWQYRMVGHGAIDWAEYLKVLASTGYDGMLSIEHEDHAYGGTNEKKQEGILIAKAKLEEALAAAGLT